MYFCAIFNSLNRQQIIDTQLAGKSDQAAFHWLRGLVDPTVLIKIVQNPRAMSLECSWGGKCLMANVACTLYKMNAAPNLLSEDSNKIDSFTNQVSKANRQKILTFTHLAAKFLFLLNLV